MAPYTDFSANNDECVEIDHVFTKHAPISHKTSGRCVSFFPSVSVRPVMHINEYTDAECDACFYASPDFKSFKKSVKKILRYVESTSKRSNIKKPCTRGVERYAKVNSAITKERRSIAYDIICDYQDDVPEYMAKLLVSSCSESRMEAHIRGCADEEAVKKC